MKFFKQHGINHIWAVPNLIVPKLKNLEDYYRLSFNQDTNDFNKQVEQEIQKPDSVFGSSNGEEEIETEQEPPPKKKKTKVITSFYNGSLWLIFIKKNRFYYRIKNYIIIILTAVHLFSIHSNE